MNWEPVWLPKTVALSEAKLKLVTPSFVPSISQTVLTEAGTVCATGVGITVTLKLLCTAHVGLNGEVA